MRYMYMYARSVLLIGILNVRCHVFHVLWLYIQALGIVTFYKLWI